MSNIATATDSTNDNIASVTEVWRYLAGDSITSVPAKLTSDQKSRYPLARFRTDWDALSEADRVRIRRGIGDGSFTYA